MAKPLPLPVWDRLQGKLVQEWMEDHRPLTRASRSVPLRNGSSPSRSMTGCMRSTRIRAGARAKSSPSSASTISTWPSSSRSGIARSPNSSTGAFVRAFAGFRRLRKKWAPSPRRGIWGGRRSNRTDISGQRPFAQRGADSRQGRAGPAVSRRPGAPRAPCARRLPPYALPR